MWENPALRKAGFFVVSSGRSLQADFQCGGLQTGGADTQGDRSLTAFVSPDDGQKQTVESGPLGGREGDVAGWITVVGGHNLSVAAEDFAGDRQIGIGHGAALAVGDAHGDKGQFLTVGGEFPFVGLHLQGIGRTGGAHLVGGPALAVLIGDGAQSARFVNHIVPAEAVGEGSFLLAP